MPRPPSAAQRKLSRNKQRSVAIPAPTQPWLNGSDVGGFELVTAAPPEAAIPSLQQKPQRSGIDEDEEMEVSVQGGTGRAEGGKCRRMGGSGRLIWRAFAVSIFSFSAN